MLEQLRSRLAAAIAPKQASATSMDVESLYKALLFRAPPSRTMPELIAGYRRVPEFRAVISKIADHVASVSWRLYVVRGSNGKARRVRAGSMADASSRRKMLAGYKRTGELEEITEHPMANLFDRANPVMSGFAARRLCQIHLDVVGETTSILTRNALRVPEAYWPIPPSWVIPPERYGDSFEIRIRGKSIRIDPEDMLWIRDLNPAEPYGRGSGVGESLGDELDISEYSAGYVKSFFYNSGKPELLIGIEGADETVLREAKQRYEEEHRGWRRAHRPFFIDGAHINVKELTSKFDDMQVVELKGAVRDTFVNTVGIPPEVLGILTNSNRATIREALRMFVTEVVVPRLERHRDEFQHSLAPIYDNRLIVDYDNPIPVDQEDQQAAMKSASWAATRGEWRESMGLEHRGEIDEVHAVPVNILFQRPSDVAASSGDVIPAVDERSRVAPALTKAGESDVENVLTGLRPDRLTYELDPIWRTQIDAWGATVLAELGVGMSFDMLNPLVVSHLEEFATNRIEDLVDQTTRNALRTQLVEGVRAGEGVRELSARVRSVFDAADKYRARTIARTEVNSSANFASWSAYKQSGVVEKRGWLTTRDGAERDAHGAVKEPYEVPIDEPFIVGGERLMYPGDPSGSAWNVINCRCGDYPVTAQPKSAEQRDALWRVFDRKLIPWETAAIAALQRGFHHQLRDVLSELDRVFRPRSVMDTFGKSPPGIVLM